MAEAACTIEEFAASDGYRWKFRRYPAAGTPRAELVCLHGIQSHGGWYEYSCTQLSRAGFGVSFLDRRGSGLNSENRGDTPSFRRLLDDIAEFVRGSGLLHGESSPGQDAANAKRKPLFVIGISWGGKLALALQRRHAGLVDGAILMCPGFVPQVRIPFTRRLAILTSRLVRPRKLYPIPLNDPELFTANPKWLEFLRNDPLALHHATARFLFESARLDRYLRRARRCVQVPVLLMLAGRDRIIDNARTRRFVEPFVAGIREYPHAHHTLEFEPDPDVFIGEIVDWLNGRLSA